MHTKAPHNHSIPFTAHCVLSWGCSWLLSLRSDKVRPEHAHAPEVLAHHYISTQGMGPQHPIRYAATPCTETTPERPAKRPSLPPLIKWVWGLAELSDPRTVASSLHLPHIRKFHITTG